MISTLRHLVVDSWLGRIIALLIFLAFVGWGVGDMVGSYNGDQANVAVRIGTRQISAQDLATAIQNEMPRAAQQMGLSSAAQLTPDIRQQVAQSVLQRMLAQNEVLALADRNGMQVPDALIRNEIFGMSVFHGTDGRFDRKLFDSKLRQIHLTERDLLAKVRDDIGARNLLEGLGNGMKVPSSVLDQLLKYNTLEHRIDLIRLDSAASPVAVAPEEAQLRRFYDLHPWLYRSSEYRHAKIVLLSADSIARTLTIPDADLRRVYEFELQKYDVPETRNLEVLTVQDRAAADGLVAAWKADGDWASIQKRNSSAAAVAFPSARQADIPSPELAKAAFAAPSGVIEGPVESPAGWIVFRVTAINPPHKTDFEHAKSDIRDEVARSQAPQILGARVATLQDAIAGSADLEQIPTDLGAVPAQGSLDAQGMTKDGEIAPLPGSDAVRKAVIARIFSQKKGEKPSLVNGPEGSAFAVLVDDIEPGHVKPYDVVREQVGHDWLHEHQMRSADERATTIMLAARKSGSVVKAVAGTSDEAAMQKNVVVSRMQTNGLPPALLSLIFSTPIGDTAMLADGDSVYVFSVNGTLAATRESTKALRASMQSQLQETMRADVPVVFVHALEAQIKPKPNMAVLQQALKAGTGQE